jgi:hypothetical protein
LSGKIDHPLHATANGNQIMLSRVLCWHERITLLLQSNQAVVKDKTSREVRSICEGNKEKQEKLSPLSVVDHHQSRDR